MKDDNSIALVWSMVGTIGLWVIVIVIGGAVMRANPAIHDTPRLEQNQPVIIR